MTVLELSGLILAIFITTIITLLFIYFEFKELLKRVKK